jgi:prephenate dehydrogenase
VKPIDRVAIIGLGLMGGSLARALAKRDVVIIGHDRRADTLDAAIRAGVVDESLDIRADTPIEADVVVFASPVDAVIQALGPIAPRVTNVRLVMDMASTKRSIVAEAEAVGLGDRFIGAHPLTGSHRSGWYAARASMFDDARVFLSPTKTSTPEALELATAFWRSLRSGVEVIDAGEHDVQMAWRSHLPQMLSTTLALVLQDAGIPRAALGPGGRDMTRLAGGAPSMWTPIAADNKEALLEAIGSFESHLAAMKQAIASSESGQTHNLLANGVKWFDGEPI